MSKRDIDSVMGDASNNTTNDWDHLVDLIEGDALIDALPYADAFDDTVKAQVEYLVEAEMKTFVPKDYLQALNDKLSNEVDNEGLIQIKGTEYTGPCYKRLASGSKSAVKEKDGQSSLSTALSAHGESTPAPSSSSVKEWTGARDQAAVKLSHESNRYMNLELSQKYGANAWLVQNAEVEKLAQEEKAKLEEIKESLSREHAQRKMEQMEDANRLFLTEKKFLETAKSNIELERVVAEKRKELNELKAAMNDHR